MRCEILRLEPKKSLTEQMNAIDLQIIRALEEDSHTSLPKLAQRALFGYKLKKQRNQEFFPSQEAKRPNGRKDRTNQIVD